MLHKDMLAQDPTPWVVGNKVQIIQTVQYTTPLHIFFVIVRRWTLYIGIVCMFNMQKKIIIILSKSDNLPFIFKHFHDQQDLQ